MDVCRQNRGKYVVQKYIENSMIIQKRKFDIRQWVLVTDWNPLTVWMYAEPYIRFAAADFSYSKIQNRFAHLSNNSVAKDAKKIKVSYEIEGNMWTLGDFQDHLHGEYGYDVWEDKLLKQIKKLIVNSCKSVQDVFDQKKG